MSWCCARGRVGSFQNLCGISFNSAKAFLGDGEFSQSNRCEPLGPTQPFAQYQSRGERNLFQVPINCHKVEENIAVVILKRTFRRLDLLDERSINARVGRRRKIGEKHAGVRQGALGLEPPWRQKMV